MPANYDLVDVKTVDEKQQESLIICFIFADQTPFKLSRQCEKGSAKHQYERFAHLIIKYNSELLALCMYSMSISMQFILALLFLFVHCFS